MLILCVQAILAQTERAIPKSLLLELQNGSNMPYMCYITIFYQSKTTQLPPHLGSGTHIFLTLICDTRCAKL